MRTKVTLLLIFLNVVLLYVIFYLRDPSNSDLDANLVLGPDAVSPEEVLIEAGPAKIHLVKREERWLLTEPTAWTANDFAVRYILNELRNLRAENTFAVEDLPKSGQTLKDYGLEKPALVLTLVPAARATGSTAAPVKVRIGDATKQGNRLYVLSPDEKRIHVVNRSLAERLSMSVSELRSEALFSISSFEAQALTLEVPPAQRTLFRRDGERWNIETLQSRASRVDTELAIGRLNALHLARFLPANLVEDFRPAFVTPSLRITLEASNRRRETLLVGPEAPKEKGVEVPEGNTAYVAKMDDDPARGDTFFVVNIPNDLAATMKRAQMELREKHVLELTPDEVTSLVIKSQTDPEISLQKLERPAGAGPAAWQFTLREGDRVSSPEPAERAVIDNLLKDLSRLLAVEFTNDAPSQAERESYGFTKPAREVTLTLASKPGAPAQTLTLLLSLGTDHRTYATLVNKEPVFRVGDDTLGMIPSSVNEYRDRVVWSLPSGAQVTGLRVTDLSSNTPCLDTAAPGAETAKADSLLVSLRNLKARRFPGTPFSPSSYDGRPEHAWRYRVELSVNLQGGGNAHTETRELLLSERLGGNLQLAALPDKNLVFELETPLVDLLFGLLVKPEPAATPTPVPPAT